MKKSLYLLVLLVSTFSFSQVGIGTTTPNASAQLDVTSTTKGFLPPRMTATERIAISSPVAGLMVYQSDGTSGLYYYSGSAWIYIVNSTGSALSVANGGTGVTSSTGTGSVVLSNSPSLVTPALGTPSALVGTNITGTAAGLNIGGNAATATTATTATNLAGGLGGSIPYQSAAGTTAMLANGTAGQVLQSNGTTLAPSWGNAGTGDMTLAGIQTVTGAKTFGAAGNVGKLVVAGSTSGTTTLNANATAGSGTVVLPTTGTLATLAGAETLINKTLTSTVSITGSSALTVAAGGTNQDVTITPTGTGNTILNGEVGVGTSSPNASAQLDVTSTTKGFAPPRMTQAQRDAIATPAAGLIVWCTNCGAYGESQVFNSVSWTNMTGGTASGIVPGVPSSISATAGIANATVSFTAPSGSPSGYIVTSTPGSFTATGASSPIVVTGLTPGTSYTFTVVATNSGGTSVASSASNAVTPTCGTSVTFTYNGASVTYGIVSSSGKCWLDRNLGATQVATSSTDANSYGHLFQWGRGGDGHQMRTSTTTTTLSSSDVPGNSNYIVSSTAPNDWRSPQNNNLWQGVNGINNPCPSGFRLPTQAEWQAELTSWGTTNSANAMLSPLKLPLAGGRSFTGGVSEEGVRGYYSSSTIGTTDSFVMYFYTTTGGGAFFYSRAYGYSVRCIRN